MSMMADATRLSGDASLNADNGENDATPSLSVHSAPGVTRTPSANNDDASATPTPTPTPTPTFSSSTGSEPPLAGGGGGGGGGGGSSGGIGGGLAGRRKRPMMLTVSNSLSSTTNSSRLLPYLILGGQESVSDAETLEKLGVTHILNVSSDIKCWFEDRIKYLRIPITDEATESAAPFFRTAHNFLDDVRKRQAAGEKVVALVHCKTGMSRSTTMVLAHMMLTPHMLQYIASVTRGSNPAVTNPEHAPAYSHIFLRDALAYIRDRRVRASPNAGFMEQLVALDSELHEGMPPSIDLEAYKRDRFGDIRSVCNGTIHPWIGYTGSGSATTHDDAFTIATGGGGGGGGGGGSSVSTCLPALRAGDNQGSLALSADCGAQEEAPPAAAPTPQEASTSAGGVKFSNLASLSAAMAVPSPLSSVDDAALAAPAVTFAAPVVPPSTRASGGGRKAFGMAWGDDDNDGHSYAVPTGTGAPMPPPSTRARGGVSRNFGFGEDDNEDVTMSSATAHSLSSAPPGVDTGNSSQASSWARGSRSSKPLSPIVDDAATAMEVDIETTDAQSQAESAARAPLESRHSVEQLLLRKESGGTSGSNVSSTYVSTHEPSARAAAATVTNDAAMRGASRPSPAAAHAPPSSPLRPPLDEPKSTCVGVMEEENTCAAEPPSPPAATRIAASKEAAVAPSGGAGWCDKPGSRRGSAARGSSSTACSVQ